MAFGMYAASVPVYQRQLGALSKVLEKGSAWAAAKKVDDAVLMGTRMIPDMLPVNRQVQIACLCADESLLTTLRPCADFPPRIQSAG